MPPADYEIIAVGTPKNCGLCGNPLPRSQPADRRSLCRPCSTFVDDRHERRERLIEALRDRVRQGNLLGNAAAVAYPYRLDYELMKLLDRLRVVQARVRIEVTDGEGPAALPTIWDGHLRRVTCPSDDRRPSDDKLGLFSSPSGLEPLWTFCDEDYANLVEIICIDPLLLGSGSPKTLWAAPPVSEEHLLEARARRESREWWAAVRFLLHALLVVAILIGGSIPFLLAASRHEWLEAIGWGSCWWLASVTAGVILGETWEPWPRVSRFWRRQ